MRKVIRWFAIALAAHLVFYAFTGLAVWGVDPDFPRVMALYLVHVVAFSAVISEQFNA